MSLQYAILGMLTYESHTGYALKSFFDNSITFVWTAKLSQIYRELSSLENQGYVTSAIEAQEGRPDKKIYTITDSGRQAFQEWIERFPAALTTAVRDEFSVHVFFGSRVNPDEMIFQMKRFIREKQDELASLERILQFIDKLTAKGAYESERLYWMLMHKRTVASCRMLIEWAEDSIKDIEAYSRENNL